MTFFPDLTSLTIAQFLFFIFAVIGMTHIIVDSNLFSSVREWIKNGCPWPWFNKVVDWVRRHRPNFIARLCPGRIYRLVDSARIGVPEFFAKVIECYQCSGTWVGFFAAFWLISWHPMVVIFGGCIASFFAYSAAVMLTYFESHSAVMPKE